MARITFKKGDDYALKLAKLGNRSEETVKKAIYAGAKVAADAIKANLNAMPTENFRRLEPGEKFDGLPARQKEDLVESFGVTPITLGTDGFWSAKVGFDGYGSTPTKNYPKGLPNQLLARSVESGSSVRAKRPFVRPAMTAKRRAILEAMKQVADDETEKTMK